MSTTTTTPPQPLLPVQQQHLPTPAAAVLRVSPLADIAADPATFLAARTARAMVGRDLTPCVVHVLNALLHAVVRAVVLSTTSTSPTPSSAIPLSPNHVLEALRALAPIDAVLSAAAAAVSAAGTPNAPAPLLPAHVTSNALNELLAAHADALGQDPPAAPLPLAVVALNTALDVIAGLLMDSLAVIDMPSRAGGRLSVETVICAISADPYLAHVVRNVGWLEVLELLADEHDDDDDCLEHDAQESRLLFPTLTGAAGAGAGTAAAAGVGPTATSSTLQRSRSTGSSGTGGNVPSPILVDPSVPSPVIRSPGLSARHQQGLPSPGLAAGSAGTFGRLPKGVKPGPLDDFDELLVSSETKKITLTPKRLRVVEAGARSPALSLSNGSTTSLPTTASNPAMTPTLPTNPTFTSLPMPATTRSPPFSPSAGSSSRPIVSNPSATWELAEFLSTTEPPASASASASSTWSKPSSTKSSARSSGFFGKFGTSSKGATSPSPSPPAPVPATLERLPPGHPKYVMLPGADDVLRHFAEPSVRPASLAATRRRSQAKPSEPDPAGSTVSSTIGANMPPVPAGPASPPPPPPVSATLPEGSAVAARMRATLAAAAAAAPLPPQGKPASRSGSSASRRKSAHASLPRGASLTREARTSPGPARPRDVSPGARGRAAEQPAAVAAAAAPRRSSSVTRSVPGHGPRGTSPVRTQVVPAAVALAPAPTPAGPAVAPAAEPSSVRAPAPAGLATLPPLPDSLADLSRPDLERLVRLLHSDAVTARAVADQARVAESDKKDQLDKLAVRAFKTITDLRKRDVEREAEMAVAQREADELRARLAQVMAVLGGIMPGLVPGEEEEARGQEQDSGFGSA